MAQPTLDLAAAAGTQIANPIRVGTKQTVAIEATMSSGDWNSAVVEAKWSIDRVTWNSFSPAITWSAIEGVFHFDMRRAFYVTLELTTDDGTAGTAAFDIRQLAPSVEELAARKQLAQSRPNPTSATLLYTPPTRYRGVIERVTVANTTGVAADYSLYHDDSGTDYDSTTALAMTVSLDANTSVTIEGPIYVAQGGNFAVQSGTADALCFTLDGHELPVGAP